MAEPERLGRSDLDAIAALLARAFAAEPVLGFLLGHERERERRLIFTALCRDVLGAGVLEGVRVDGRARVRGGLDAAGGASGPAAP